MIKRSLSTLRERARRWMQRVRTPEVQPIRLPQNRIYVLPSASGLAMGITLVLMLVTSINYTLSLGFAFTFLIGGVGVAHILASWRNLLGLEIRIHPVGEAFAGGEAAFTVTLAAPGDAPGKQRQDIEIRHPDAVAPLRLDLRNGQPISGTLSLRAPKRGLRPLGRVTIECRAPLGWVRAWSYVLPDTSALVYPQALGTLSPGETASAISDTGRQATAGHDEFAGLRTYHPGDSPRHIAWKQVARGAPMMAKQFAGGSSQDWLLDWQAMPPRLDVEARLSQLTRWVLDARTQGLRTVLRLPGSSIGPAEGAAHHQACLRALALYKSGLANG